MQEAKGEEEDGSGLVVSQWQLSAQPGPRREVSMTSRQQSATHRPSNSVPWHLKECVPFHLLLYFFPLVLWLFSEGLGPMTVSNEAELTNRVVWISQANFSRLRPLASLIFPLFHFWGSPLRGDISLPCPSTLSPEPICCAHFHLSPAWLSIVSKTLPTPMTKSKFPDVPGSCLLGCLMKWGIGPGW